MQSSPLSMEPDLESEEHRLRIELMQADIENKRADSDYKRGLLRFEPWKIAFTAFGAGAAFVAALVALLSLLLGHR